MIALRDRQILRELAKRYMEIAADGANDERRARMTAINDLKPARPPVWIEEIPWHEMDIDGQLQLICEDAEARAMERFFRRALFKWKYFQADMIADGCYYVAKAFDASDTGVSVRETTVSLDGNNNIKSHQYEDQLDTEEKVDALRLPVIVARPDIDAANLQQAHDVLDGVMPVALRGVGSVSYAPWDTISMLRGAGAILIDLAERPELMHRTINKFTEIGITRFEQMEAQGLLDCNLPSLHCTPPYTDDLPAKDYDGGRVRLKDVWFRGMAQIFAAVSPAMHEEFDIRYMRRLSDRCGLAYYGCCEQMDTKIDIVAKMPNLRKIGVSPWANVRFCAERMGGKYVFARKPNPAHVAVNCDRQTVEREIRETVELCLENGCPCEFVLKDISTVSYKPENIINWNIIVQETLDQYYR